MLEEVAREMIGASRWQRLSSRKDVRNGTYLRRLITTMGAAEVAGPRTRESGSPVDVKLKALLKEFGARTQQALDAAIRRAMDLIRRSDAAAWFTHCGYEAHAN